MKERDNWVVLVVDGRMKEKEYYRNAVVCDGVDWFRVRPGGGLL
jgi:hypothetical protein